MRLSTIILVLMKEQNIENIRSYGRFTFVEGNLLDLSLMPLLEGVDYVFHQASQAGVRASWGRSFSNYTDLTFWQRNVCWILC